MSQSRKSFLAVVTNAAFKLIPTIMVVGYLWWLWMFSTAELHADPWGFMATFSIGMILSYFLYAQNVRFSITFLALVGVLWAVYQLMASSSSGEFDALYYSISFLSLAVAFVTSWLVGFGFARVRIFPWIAALAVLLVAGSRIVTEFPDASHLMNVDVVRWLSTSVFTNGSLLFRLFTTLALIFTPVLFYAVYIIFINEMLAKFENFDLRNFFVVLRKSGALSAILLLILMAPFAYILMFGFPDFLEEKLQESAANSASFLKKTYNQGTNQPEFDLNDYAQLLPEVKLSDETVFCTYIDNFFPTRDGGKIPLPVHFRRFVLNRFEPRTEKFVLDPYPPSAIPSDLFSPATRDVPIGFSVEDSVIEAETRRYEQRKEVTSTVYIQTLSPDAFVAPNTGYSYRKMPVPPEDKETFHTVYQSKSIISLFNLPPFVFSSSNPELMEYRQMRQQALENIGGYDQLDSTFMRYYTQIDESDSLIINLANEITAGIENPYHKVQAIIDYFFAKDEEGNPIFTYTLEPGSPPTAEQSFMHYFLFDNKKGYCTYFAGATVLLLRAAGIPCRMTVGYAIYDRSNKNTGWYWVYADQGHAWLEVYFPGYGWIDFDTTPSDDNESMTPPKPDATPPQYARSPVLSVLGEVTGIGGDSTSIFVRPYKLTYKEDEFDIDDADSEIIELKPDDGTVTIDNEKVAIGEFEENRKMVLSAYSFNYDLEKLPSYKERYGQILSWMDRRFPKPIPVDEAIIVYQEEEQTEEGLVFAVDGHIQSFSSDSTALVVAPTKIQYRGKDYPVDQRLIPSVTIRPRDGKIQVDEAEIALPELQVGDSMLIAAESSDKVLQAIKPYLATEPFPAWFKNSFPAQIPVDKVTLQLPETPLIYQVLWTLLWIVLLAALDPGLAGPVRLSLPELANWLQHG